MKISSPLHKNETSIFLGTIYREFTGDNERNVIDGILNLLSSADNFYYLKWVLVMLLFKLRLLSFLGD